jgi:hypothetical protein
LGRAECRPQQIRAIAEDPVDAELGEFPHSRGNVDRVDGRGEPKSVRLRETERGLDLSSERPDTTATGSRPAAYALLAVRPKPDSVDAIAVPGPGGAACCRSLD